MGILPRGCIVLSITASPRFCINLLTRNAFCLHSVCLLFSFPLFSDSQAQIFLVVHIFSHIYHTLSPCRSSLCFPFLTVSVSSHCLNSNISSPSTPRHNINLPLITESSSSLSPPHHTPNIPSPSVSLWYPLPPVLSSPPPLAMHPGHSLVNDHPRPLPFFSFHTHPPATIYIQQPNFIAIVNILLIFFLLRGEAKKEEGKRERRKEGDRIKNEGRVGRREGRTCYKKGRKRGKKEVQHRENE